MILSDLIFVKVDTVVFLFNTTSTPPPLKSKKMRILRLILFIYLKRTHEQHKLINVLAIVIIIITQVNKIQNA